MNNNIKHLSRASVAVSASLTAMLLAGAATPAQALPGFFGNTQPMPTMTRPDTNAPRIVRPSLSTPASRLKPTVVASKTPAAASPSLADRAKGPLQILISLDKQELTLLAGGEVIAHSRVSSGQRGRATPTGVFSIIQKDRWHRSNLYDDAPMYFMQRITWSGVALHQGIVPNYPASHGCVRLPESFARELWPTTRIGARVIITHEQAIAVDIQHPALFVPRREPAAPAVAQLPMESIKAAQQAWTFAELASSKPLGVMTMTDSTPAFSMPEMVQPPFARPVKTGQLSVFISRKEGRLFVRKGFEPLFDMPVAIDRPTEPLGTHVFTALALKSDGSLRWNVVSTATSPSEPAVRPSVALDRITIPQEAVERISELAAPGTSLIITDQGLGSETGKGTDFIVLTR